MQKDAGGANVRLYHFREAVSYEFSAREAVRDSPLRRLDALRFSCKKLQQNVLNRVQRDLSNTQHAKCSHKILIKAKEYNMKINAIFETSKPSIILKLH